jgi:hypothetical protein
MSGRTYRLELGKERILWHIWVDLIEVHRSFDAVRQCLMSAHRR